MAGAKSAGTQARRSRDDTGLIAVDEASDCVRQSRHRTAVVHGLVGGHDAQLGPQDVDGGGGGHGVVVTGVGWRKGDRQRLASTGGQHGACRRRVDEAARHGRGRVQLGSASAVP